MRLALKVIGVIVLILSGLAAYLWYDSHTWRNPSDDTARAWMSRLLNYDIPESDQVVLAAREGFIDFSGCVLFELESDLRDMLQNAQRPENMEDYMTGCPENFYTLDGIHLNRFEYVAGFRFADDEFLIVSASADQRYALFYYVLH